MLYFEAVMRKKLGCCLSWYHLLWSIWSWYYATICNFFYDASELPCEINVSMLISAVSSFLHALLTLLNNMQDLLALKEDYTTRPAVEETINDPTNPKHYWRYRMCFCPSLSLYPHSPPTSKRNWNLRVNFSCLSVVWSKLKLYLVVKFKYTERSTGAC